MQSDIDSTMDGGHSSIELGPYRGFRGVAIWHAYDRVYRGHTEDSRGLFTYQGRTPDEVNATFRESADDYVAFCGEDGD